MQRKCLGKKDEVRFEIFLRRFLKTQVEDSQKTKRWVLGANAGISFQRDANATIAFNWLMVTAALVEKLTFRSPTI